MHTDCSTLHGQEGPAARCLCHVFILHCQQAKKALRAHLDSEFLHPWKKTTVFLGVFEVLRGRARKIGTFGRDGNHGDDDLLFLLLLL